MPEGLKPPSRVGQARDFRGGDVAAIDSEFVDLTVEIERASA